MTGGLALFRDGQIRMSYSGADGLAEGRVRHLRFDRNGALWIATDGGLNRLKDGRMPMLTSKNGLPCEGVLWTIEDDAEPVWLNTLGGLVRVARWELAAWASGRKNTIQTTVFDGSDGGGAPATTGTYTPRVGKAPDGKIWFFSLDGIGAIDPRHIAAN